MKWITIQIILVKRRHMVTYIGVNIGSGQDEAITKINID